MAEDRSDKAFDFAADIVKQLISLAAGIVTITITFSENIIDSSNNDKPGLLIAAWIAFAFSILFGLWTLMALTGSLGRTESDEDRNNDTGIYRKGITYPVIGQIILFLAGLVLAICYGGFSISARAQNEEHPEAPIIIQSTEYKMEQQLTPDSLDVKASVVFK